MRRLVPYPLFALALIFMWLVLNGFHVGQVIIAVPIAVLGGMTMRHLEPEKVKIHRVWLVPLLFARVFIDITRSNIATGRIILSGGRYKAKSGFMLIPLEIKSATSIALLGMILTATPGTAWIAYGAKRNEILLHVLDLADENQWRLLIRNRYEILLKEIFG